MEDRASLDRSPVPVHLKLALDAVESAEMIGLSVPSLRRLVKKGVLARVPHTDRLLIARAELERFVTSSMTSAPLRAVAS